MMRQNLQQQDPDVYDITVREHKRQNDNLILIASENYVSQAVLEAQGSIHINKYAEGVPNKRYYPGCEIVDEVEILAIERLKKIFGCEHANVQPHSGASANLAAFFALAKPGDKILGMNLSEGGHLSHGSKFNVSGKWFESVFYGVDKNGYIDYDVVLEIAKREKPKIIIAGASAYSRTVDFAKFREIANQVDAYLLADIAHIAGPIAAGLHPNPIAHAHVTTSTTQKTLRGPRGGIIMCDSSLANDIDKAVFPGTQGGPLMNTIAAKAVAFGEALKPEYKDYQRSVLENAKTLAKSLQQHGIKIVSGGTDNHLLLIDLIGLELTGKQLEDNLLKVNIVANRNTVPGDTRKAYISSGLRLGTPATTTRGLQCNDFVLIAKVVADMINIGVSSCEQSLKIVQDICKRYPIA
ncbi:MAG: serine hydroxymethyltransferase [Firmicutes bacterium]|nr:serine hydroxymethyltransferase [Bacillota bacterium]MCL1953653.1 serine hydroxymethyltransferase [Bacillota bacterium]